MAEHMLAYAKYTCEKDKIQLAGVYFGGLYPSKQEAELGARTCVNTIKGGTVFPIIRALDNALDNAVESCQNAFFDAFYNIMDRVETQNASMQDTQDILNRTFKRR